MKLYRPAKLERIEVVWSDAQHDAEFDGNADSYEAALSACEDIGYFVRLTRDTLTLASCREPKTGTVRFMLNIPRTLIREIRSLERPLPEVA
jgi:hypothetical protein